jgi:hypothetical protein
MVVANPDRVRRRHARCKRHDVMPNAFRRQEPAITEGNRSGAGGADRAQIDRTVSPTAGMVHGRRGGSADFAFAVRSFENLFQGRLRRDTLPQRPASAEHEPKSLSQENLAFPVYDVSIGNSRSELANECRFAATIVRAIRRSCGGCGFSAIGTLVGGTCNRTYRVRLVCRLDQKCKNSASANLLILVRCSLRGYGQGLENR